MRQRSRGREERPGTRPGPAAAAPCASLGLRNGLGAPMQCLDFERLESIDPEAYRARRPYPFVNPRGLLTPAGFQALLETLPPLALFQRSFGTARGSGQRPHDRYTLEYDDRTDALLAPAWRQLLRELRGDRYRRCLARLFQTDRLALSFHWHYAPRGASVSPHCDSSRKLGSHIFYFQTQRDWRPEWGGQTLLLDAGGRLPSRSAPELSDFDAALPALHLDNRSLLFSRGPHSWHGVEEIRCPEGRLRRVFIVVVNRDGPLQRLRARLSGRRIARY